MRKLRAENFYDSYRISIKIKAALITLLFLLIAIPVNAQTEIMRFAVIGDFGSGDANAASVANLVKSWNPNFIVTTGDNNYPNGEAATIDQNIGQFYSEFIYPYQGAYGPGSPTPRFFPSVGNHDWDNTVGPPLQPYLDYFALPGNERYYDFAMGPVHFFMLDSDVREPDGVTATSPQAQWLQARLAQSQAPWKIIILHHAPFSSRTSYTKLQWPYQQWGAHAVINGHAHLYERIMKNGLPYITNGLGGDSTGSFPNIHPDSVCRFGTNYGAMLVTVSQTSITFRFITRTGQLIDTLTLGPDAVPPSAPANLTAAPVSLTQINLAWADTAFNEDGYVIEQSLDGNNFAPVGNVSANVTTFSAINLAPGTGYHYRVRGQNNAGPSGYSNPAFATTFQAGPPTAPANLAAAPAGGAIANLSWQDTSGVETGFTIERCQGQGCTNFAPVSQPPANATTAADTGLVELSFFRYRMFAFNTYGASDFSNIAEVATPLGEPVNLAGNPLPGGQANIYWIDTSNQEAGFRIERCRGNSCTDFAIIAEVPANTTGFIDSGLRPNTNYRYRVFAFNPATFSFYSNIVRVRTTP